MIERLPVRVRVAAAFALAMAAVLTGTALFLYLRLDSHLGLALDRELQLRAQDVTALVGQPGASLAGDGSGRLVEPGESYAQLLDLRGRVLDATPPLGSAALLSANEIRAARSAPLFATRSAIPGLDEPSRLLATGVSRDGVPAVLVVGATGQDRAETLAAFRDELFVAGPVALILATGVGYALAGLSLRQVDSMRRRASAISADTPKERLPVPPTGDELERLGRTLNEMLERLQTAIERERGFVADAGHELRTPLAHLRTELELVLRQAETADELRDAVRRSSQEADRLSQLAESLLLIARADRGDLSLRLEDLGAEALLATVATRFEWRAHELGKAVRVSAAPGIRVHGDRLRLEQALGNLVDNALRHGGRTVDLSAVAGEGRVLLRVHDDGAGFPAGFLDRAFERFSRPDASRTGRGAGLGLAIVRTIAEAHGGSAGITTPGLPGADVWVSIPAAAGRGERRA